MANLDELEELAAAREAEVSERVKRFRELHTNRMLPAAREPVVIPLEDLLRGTVTGNPDLDRAAESISREDAEKAAQEGARRLAATISGTLDDLDERIEAVIATPQPVVDTSFKVQHGRVYVYDRLPDGTSVQRDVTSNYYRGTGGRMPEDASKRDRWNRLPPIMQPVVMAPSRMTQTSHDAHLGGVED